MGFLADSQKEGFGSSWGGLKSLVRRKQVDSAHFKRLGHQLAKELTVPHLIAIGNNFILFLVFLEENFDLGFVCFNCFLGKFDIGFWRVFFFFFGVRGI